MAKYSVAYHFLISLMGASLCGSCNNAGKTSGSKAADQHLIRPVVITDTTLSDTDDPAIWINPVNKDSSLIIGTDKDPVNGGLYVFDLNGRIDRQRTVTGLKRPNNVDIAYGLTLNQKKVDIAVTTERNENRIRVFSLPDMQPVDGGGIEVFKDEKHRQPMGIGLYTRPSDHAIFAIVSRKSGPRKEYLEEYLLQDNGRGQISGKLVRKFGSFSGKREIEAIAVDNEMGYVYYCDEQAGIRKYYADPEKGDQELAIFGQGDFKADNEGISIYKLTDSSGYIIVSDQFANRFNVYSRTGTGIDHDKYKKITSIPLQSVLSDGSEVTSTSLPGFPHGLFVAMSDDKTFQFYRWQDIATRYGLKVRE